MKKSLEILAKFGVSRQSAKSISDRNPIQLLICSVLTLPILNDLITRGDISHSNRMDCYPMNKSTVTNSKTTHQRPVSIKVQFISLSKSSAGHRTLQCHATGFDPRLNASSSCSRLAVYLNVY